MAFIGNDGSNLPRPEDVNRCKFGGKNNSRAKGGCGKHVVRTGQRIINKEFGTEWFSWFHFDYCEEHFDLQTEYKDGVAPTLETG